MFQIFNLGLRFCFMSKQGKFCLCLKDRLLWFEADLVK